MKKGWLAVGLSAALGLGAMAAAALGFHGFPGEGPGERDGRIGLMSSLPLYRAPESSVAEALAAQSVRHHWVRAVLEKRGTLEPLDVLDPDSLAQIDRLLLVQPRALTAAENVALDTWVRAGGNVLLVADPLLVGEPRFALGDPRNPQAISLSGPILARWGLALEPGKEGDDGVRFVSVGDHDLPVALGGRFSLRPAAGGGQGDCRLRNDALIAVCSIGAGRVVALADATLFESDPAPAGAEDMLAALLGMARDDVR